MLQGHDIYVRKKAACDRVSRVDMMMQYVIGIEKTLYKMHYLHMWMVFTEQEKICFRR